VPTTRRHRTVHAPVAEVWDVVADPYHFPRWWPRVGRVEGVQRRSWTKVFMTSKGRPLRADYRLLESEPKRRLEWEQELEGSPFEKVLARAVTEVCLAPQDGQSTRVTIELRQVPRGFSRFGGLMMRRASRSLIDEALEGLSGACER
jgi:uncharacterized protein YndB with AHSA1/START domain